MQVRQIILDTETTGLDPAQGHRVIEIGCVELVNRRLTGNHFHRYLQPDREIDAAAVEVHGITREFLAGKPRFTEIVKDFLDFVRGAELIIHNAPFDVGFLNYELSRLEGYGSIADICGVVDTLVMARRLHPGQKNTLDALCKRYSIDNAQRILHGALLDAEILADVYLAMTGGQVALSLETEVIPHTEVKTQTADRQNNDRSPLVVIRANPEEYDDHSRYLENLDKNSGGNCLWKRLEI